MNQTDEGIFVSMKGIMKNNGFFKSRKQKDFVLKAWGGLGSYEKVNGWLDLKPGQKTVTLDYLMVWASYGSRSQVPGMFVFVLDENGVCSQYKVGGNGNLRDGWSPAKEKLRLVWERPTDVSAPNFDEVAAPVESEPESQWIGAVGDKLKDVECTVIGVNHYTPSNRYSEGVFTHLKDSADNIIVVWKYIAEKGQKVVLSGTVKECSDYNGKKKTVLARVKFVEV